MNSFLSAASICWNVVLEKPDATAFNLRNMIFSSHLAWQNVCLFHGQCPSDKAVSQQDL
jgi:hypothetical protein